MSDDTDKLKQLILNARTSKSLNLNVDEKAEACRKLFIKLVKSFCGSDDKALSSLKLLEVPTDDYTSQEEDFVEYVARLQSLKVCILKGGRRKKGLYSKGGIKQLPWSFRTLTEITSLDLSFNRMQNIPECISELISLVELKIDFNELQELSFSVKKLTNLKHISAKNNGLKYITEQLQYLPKLETLQVSSNKLEQLPDTLCYCANLKYLNVSKNLLKALPVEVLMTTSLISLNASHNEIDCLDFEVIDKIKIQCLDLQYNFIKVPTDFKPQSSILLQGNIPHCSKKVSAGNVIDEYDVPCHDLESDVNQINLEPSLGGKYVLPSGPIITLPKYCLSTPMDLYYKVIFSEGVDFELQATDQLLSCVLEMRPNGMVFEKPVRIELPFLYSGFDHKKRQITMRVMSFGNGCWKTEDLNSELSDIGGSRVAAYTMHFSLFAVVSKLIENTVQVQQNNSSCLISTTSPLHKLVFPIDSVQTDTSVSIQVLSVDQKIVHQVTESTNSVASDILSVRVLPAETIFNKPVTVHLALPLYLVGKSFDKEQLHLMKCTRMSEEWSDITPTVELTFSITDVSFTVNSFSKFALVWSNVCGVMKKIYRRLITYPVQFIAMQREKLPTVVLAQCLRSQLVEQRIKQLKEQGYTGDDSYSVVHHLMEGDKYRIKVLGEVQIKHYDDFQDMDEKILLQRFYSQYPPDKSGFCKFCIEPKEERKQVATGYVSFHQIVQPESLVLERTTLDSPRAVQPTSKKRTHDETMQGGAGDHGNVVSSENNTVVDYPEEELVPLDNILVSLKQLDTSVNLPDPREYIYNYDDLGSGMFNEHNLRFIASKVGTEWRVIGTALGLRKDVMDRIKMDHPGQTDEQIFAMLWKWTIRHSREKDCIEKFTEAMELADRADIASVVRKIYADGLENFNNKRRRELADLPGSSSQT